MTNYYLGEFVSKIEIGKRLHLKSIDFKNVGLTLKIIELLYKNGIIRKFIVNSNNIKIFFKFYKNQPLYFTIKLVSKPGHRIFLSLSKLSLEYNRHNLSSFYILTTNQGLKTSTESLLGGGSSGEVLLKVII